MDRTALHRELVTAILDVRSDLNRPVRVGIDGRDTAGKTTLADELAEVLDARGVPVIRASIDGFHRPREDRYRRGSDSPEGFYRDSFDLEALERSLLDPLDADGDRRYVTAVFDHREDEAVEQTPRTAPADAVLLFDGIFIHRPRLRDVWDYSVYLDVPRSVVLERALERDAADLGGPAATRDRYETRYLPGQDIYHAEADPMAAADVVVDNADVTDPELRDGQSTAAGSGR